MRFLAAAASTLLFAAVAAQQPYPSRALEVDLAITRTDVDSVAAATEAFLSRQGLKKLAPGGRDAIHGTKTAFDYTTRTGSAIVSVSIDQATNVPMRVSSVSDEILPEANLLFEALKSELEVRWPGSTTEVP